MTITTGPLVVHSEGLRLPGGVCAPHDPRGLIVFLHGIPSTAPADPDDSGYLGVARAFAERGWAGAWADLRGKQGSEGYFSIEGWVRDAKAVVEAARRELVLMAAPLVLVGSSAGGAVAAEVAHRYRGVDALALLAAPAEWQGFAGDPIEGARKVQVDAGMPIAPEAVNDPTDWAAEFQRVTTESVIGSLEIPILIVHGTADDVVPVAHAHVLAERAPRARREIIPGAHHQLRRWPGIVDVVADWLDAVVR